MRMTKTTKSVMRALIHDPATASYGLGIMGATGLPSGTVYPILHRLQAKGWLLAAWEEIDPKHEGRPPRKQYWVTGEGEVAMAAHLVERHVATVRQRRAEGFT